MIRRLLGTKVNKSKLNEAMEFGPKFSDFIEMKNSTNDNLPGDGRLPKWLKTPIAVGQRYSHLKETLRDLKLHTVLIQIIVYNIDHFISGVRRGQMSKYWRLLEWRRVGEGNCNYNGKYYRFALNTNEFI